MNKEEAADLYEDAIVNDKPSSLPNPDYINEYLIDVGTNSSLPNTKNRKKHITNG